MQLIKQGFTAIEIMPMNLCDFAQLEKGSGERSVRRVPTGARVIIEFALREALPRHRVVRVHYDLGGDGRLREVRSRPQLTHSTQHLEGGRFHYRISHWIAAEQLMQFVVPEVAPK